MRMTMLALMLLATQALALTEQEEHRILMRVVHAYELDMDAARLLFAIRAHEKGGPGLEFGVGQEARGHRAKRYRHDPARSLEIQARWAAGTIRRHFGSSVRDFARIYCPRGHEAWARSVSKLMRTKYRETPR